EAKTGPRDVLASDDVVPMRETPDTALKIHLGAHMLAAVFRDQSGFEIGRRIDRLFRRRFGEILGLVELLRGCFALAGFIGPLPERGRTAALAEPYDALVDKINVRFQVALFHRLASLATGALQHDAVRIFLGLRY